MIPNMIMNSWVQSRGGKVPGQHQKTMFKVFPRQVGRLSMCFVRYSLYPGYWAREAAEGLGGGGAVWEDL